MEVHIISPEGDVFQGTADAVFLPGTLGGFEVLDGHAPLVSTLGKGRVLIRRAAGFSDARMREDLAPQGEGTELSLEVSSGVAQTSEGRLTVLID